MQWRRLVGGQREGVKTLIISRQHNARWNALIPAPLHSRCAICYLPLCVAFSKTELMLNVVGGLVSRHQIASKQRRWRKPIHEHS